MDLTPTKTYANLVLGSSYILDVVAEMPCFYCKDLPISRKRLGAQTKMVIAVVQLTFKLPGLSLILVHRFINRCQEHSRHALLVTLDTTCYYWYVLWSIAVFTLYVLQSNLSFN